MKSSATYLILCFFMFGCLFSISSCSKKGCTNPKSDNYNPEARKDDGTCILWKDKFIGTFSGINNCTPGSSFDITVTGTADDSTLIIEDNNQTIFNAYASSEFEATIPEQSQTSNGQQFTISGTFSLNGSNFTMAYDFSSGGSNPVTCTATGSKQ